MIRVNDKAQRGFTLAETLVALVVGMIMLVAIYSVVNMAQKSTTGIERKVVAQQDARVALGIMALEIRMASYSLFSDNTIWANPSTCATNESPTLRRGIREATANSITIEMDIDNSRFIGDAGNEIIRYEYLPGGTDLRITRQTISCPGVTTAGAQPFLGPSSDDPGASGVRVINGSLTPPIPLFRYFDGMENPIASPVPNNQLSNIRRMVIAIAVETTDVDPSTNKKRTLIYGTSVIPKNHGINSAAN